MSLLPHRRWDPAIRAALENMIESHAGEGRVATLDWDNTMIRGDVGEAVLLQLDAEDAGGRMAEYERLCHVEGKEVGYPWCAYQIAGSTVEQARALADRVIDAWLADGRIELRPEMQDLVSALHDRGWQPWIVSASAEPLVQAFAARYGIGPDRVIGMRLAEDEDGRLLPRLAGPSTFRAGKVEAIDRYIGTRPCFAAGDTETDIEMLDSARYRLLMDRGDPSVQEAAARGRWWVQRVSW